MKKLNNILKNNISNIVIITLILQPFIDVIIGLSSGNYILSTLSSLIRMFILIFLCYYLYFICSNKSNKKRIVLLLSIFYLILYIFHMNFALFEIKAALKIFYFPILFSCLLCIKEENKDFIEEKYLLFPLFIYSFVIIFAFITNTSFNSYAVAKEGSVGYFLAANEIGAIFAILLPLVFNFVFHNNNIKKTLFFIIIISAILIMGTKTPFISLIICSVYYYFKSINKKNIIKLSVIPILSIIVLVIILPMTPIYDNILIHASFLKLNSIKDIIEKPELLDHFIMGSRIKLLKENTAVYLDSSFEEKIMGIGYTKHEKLVEMDLNDILYRQGLIGFTIYFITIFYLLFSKNNGFNKDYILPVILIILISIVVGHVITAPAVSTFASYILCKFKKEEKV